jgi:hypothetical protein
VAGVATLHGGLTSTRSRGASEVEAAADVVVAKSMVWALSSSLVSESAVMAVGLRS